MSMSPLASAARTVTYLVTGRIRFPRWRVGASFVDERGQHFTVFREVVIKPSSDQPERPGAVFVPHFHVAGMSPRLNIAFSLVPIPFYVGLPGFRSKCWMIDEASGDFSGYYEWDTVEAAQNYAASFAMRFMTNRSLPESVWGNVYPVDHAPAAPARPLRAGS